MLVTPCSESAVERTNVHHTAANVSFAEPTENSHTVQNVCSPAFVRYLLVIQ